MRPGPWLATLCLLALAFCFHEPVVAYVSDSHYRNHFLFLWAFFVAAVFKTARGRLVWRLQPGARCFAGVGLGCVSLLLLHAGLITGSSTVQRLALVTVFTAWLLVAVVGWGTRRCLAYGAFALLCFGVPHSAYFQLTKLFRLALVFLLELLPAITPLDFKLEGLVVVFPHYALAITPECSGFNQLLTFVGLAFVGSLTGQPNRWRTVLLFVLGVMLAYAANLARVVVFILLVAVRQSQFIDDERLHELVGFASYAPFIVLFLWVILRSHRPMPAPQAVLDSGRRGLSVAWLLVPFVGLRLLHLGGVEPSVDEPAYMSAVTSPPGYVLVQRSPTEPRERRVYDTPWLINATYADAQGDSFELFSYLTRSRRHLAVHQVSQCLDVPGVEVRYGPSITVEGRRYWTLELIGQQSRYRGYFSFWVDGEDHDDSLATQAAVFWNRLVGEVVEVGLTRFLMPGPLIMPVPERDRQILAWRARQLNRR